MRRLVRVIGAWSVGMGVAHAQAPDRLSATLEVGGGSLGRLSSTESGDVVVGIANRRAALLDLDRWVVGAPDPQPCDATAIAAHDDATDGTVEVAIGCSNGSIHLYSWNGRAFTDWRGSGAATVRFAGQEIRALVWPWEDEDARLFALVEAETGTGNEGVTLQVGSDGYTEVTDGGEVLLQDGFGTAVVNPFGAGGATEIVIRHGTNRWSRWTPVSGSLVVNPQLGGLDVGIDDLAPRTGGFAWAVTDDGDLANVNVSVSQVVNVVQSDLDGATSLVEIPNEDGSLVDSFGIFTDDGLVIQDGLGASAVELDAVEAGNLTVVDLAAPRSGYVIGGTNGGDFAVFSRAPWIGTLELSPDNGVSGTEISYAFSSDGPGDWTVQAGGSRTEQPSGDEVASGTLTDAGEVDGTFTIPASLEEGENIVWAFVTDPDTGERGYAAASLTVDNAPEKVVLRDGDVGFADGGLRVTIRLLDANDIEAYDVYVSDTSFSAEDFPSGGPETTLLGKTYPRTVTPPDDAGDTMQITVSPLDNGTTYYVAIRARDTGGAEGEMSRVVDGTPQSTCTAAECAGDPGGCQKDANVGCATTGSGGMLAISGLLGLAAVRRRRRASMAALAPLAMVGLLAASAPAHAQDAQPANPFSAITDKDITPAWVNVEASYGSFTFVDDNIRAVHGNTAGIFRLEVGAQLFRYVEFDLGLGYLGPKGNTVTDSGVQSAEEVRLKWLPMNMALTGRIHILDEQPIVPYARIGLDMVFWRQVKLDSDSKPLTTTRINGSKRGWHWGAGANILLDLFMPRRASMLEANTGINDTWLFVEYRRQYINGSTANPLDFGGWNVSAGLKLDY